MGTKTFIYDVRGYRRTLSARIDADYAAWYVATSPTSVEAVTSSISDDTLVITVQYTA